MFTLIMFIQVVVCVILSQLQNIPIYIKVENNKEYQSKEKEHLPVCIKSFIYENDKDQ